MFEVWQKNSFSRILFFFYYSNLVLKTTRYKNIMLGTVTKFHAHKLGQFTAIWFKDPHILPTQRYNISLSIIFVIKDSIMWRTCSNILVIIDLTLVLSYNIIDVDDILSDDFMPGTLLMLENPQNSVKNFNETFGESVPQILDGSFNKAMETMGFHR